MIMRDTIFCAVPPDADTDAIIQSVFAMEKAVQEYVPGYRLLQEPQIDEPSAATQGQTKVSVFVEVEGAGDYLPPYSGNLDIMTAAAAQVGENIARAWTSSMTDIDALDRTWSGTHGDEPWGELDLRLTDTCLRDGSHHKRHQFTAQEVHDIVEALDNSGVPVIEVTHGDGLGGSSFNYGFSKTPEQELIKIAAETAKRAKIAFLMLPGVGTKDDIRAAQDNGGQICRIATHCTEADISIQHFGLARELGLETVGFLMMSHTQPPEVLAKQARIMVDAGCQCVYVVDSAGALIMEQTARPGLRAGRRDRRRRRRRLPRPREPRPRRRQHRHRGPCGRHPDRRLGPPLRRRRRQHAARGVHRGLRQARLDDRRRLPPDRRRVRGRHQAGDARGVPARPDDADDGLRRGLLVVPQARRQRRRPLRRLRRQDPARGRPPQADRRPGGPAHRHRADAQGRAGQGSSEQLVVGAGHDQPGLVGEHDGLHPVAQPELAQDRVTWVFTVASPTKSASPISALLSPRRELAEDLPLPGGEQAEPRVVARCAGPGEALHQPAGDHLVDQHVAAVDLPDRLDEPAARSVLEQEPGGAGRDARDRRTRRGRRW